MAAPKGNRFAANAAYARRALEAVLDELSGQEPVEGIERFEALKDIWREQFSKAKGGDNDSARMIIDRLDGKPAQAINVGGQDDNPVQVSHEWKLQPVSANRSDS